MTQMSDIRKMKLAGDLDAVTLESIASPPSDPMFYI